MHHNLPLPPSLSPRHGRVVVTWAVSAMLVACAGAPQPPAVDESTRRPANDPARIERLRSQSEGERSRMELDLQRRQQEAYRTAADLRAEAMRPAVKVSASLERASKNAPGANTVYTARFASGSSQLSLSAEEMQPLILAARSSPMIVVRGRTDAEVDNPTQSRLARERAEAMRKLLVAAGIAPDRIRVQYQGAGDFVVDNQSPQGRAQNRRVEVELYGVSPGVTALTLKPASTSVAE